MILRYLVLFGGIVLMITGCNSLISQQFGTHRLRTIPLGEVLEMGVGDADFIELTSAEIGAAMIVGKALRTSDKDYVLRPILTPSAAAEWAQGNTVTAKMVGWTETLDTDCTTFPGCPPEVGVPIRGLISAPTDKKNPLELWEAQRINLDSNPVYLQLYQQPLAWYWNLIILLVGLALAIIPEARRHAKREQKE